MIWLVLAAVIAGFAVYWVSRTYSDAPPVRADEVHWAKTGDLWQLRLCRFKAKGKERNESIILCHGLASNHYMFAFPNGDSLVDVLTEHGYDCWLVDLRGTRSSVPPFGRSFETPTVNDIVQRDVLAVLQHVQQATGRVKAHWVGHSMGGMAAYAHILLSTNPGIATLTMIGSPLSFGGSVWPAAIPALILRWISRRAFRAICLPGLTLAQMLRLRCKAMPVNWANLHRDTSARTVFDTIEAAPPRVLFRMALSVHQRQWRVGERQLDMFASLPELTVPLLAVYGGGDRVAPAAKMQAAFDKIGSRDKRFVAAGRATGYSADYDHADLLLGRAAREEIFEPVAAWIEEHPLEAERSVGRHTRHHHAAPRHAAPAAPAAPVKATARTSKAAAVEAPAKPKGDGHKPAAAKTVKPAAKPKAKPAPKKPTSRKGNAAK